MIPSAFLETPQLMGLCSVDAVSILKAETRHSLTREYSIAKHPSSQCPRLKRGPGGVQSSSYHRPLDFQSHGVPAQSSLTALLSKTGCPWLSGLG